MVFIQYISTSSAKIVKYSLIWETDGFDNHLWTKTKLSPILRHIYNVDRPLLMLKDIRGVTVRGFPVSITFISNSRDLLRFLWKYQGLT